ncbi:putative aldouronate transport system permease protein [Jiangella alkaliphila]|uniref:Putative aldouronate transport system permease protein n=2 Tax=Jiangella alkaliphila TaxID=419479 RepID=A0A1H2L7W1_9ACTN|nr:ABC transporter permease subunit [Jiangella alkaliphila]SDU76892.1 putative aldouronate transport system permease protein [Jiangella alkaliphila]
MTLTTRPARPTAAGTPASGGERSRGSWRRRVRRDRALLLMMVPGLAYFMIFDYLPMLGNVIAFQDYVPFIGFADSEWVGLANFERMFTDPAFWQASWNTVVISVLQLVFFFPVPIALALLLHSLTRDVVRRFVQSIVYLPHFLSWVIVVALFQQVLGTTGLLNGVLGDAGLHTVHVLGNPDMFKPLAVLQVIWKDAGWGTIIFLAALSRVDDQLYEAAAIDGAGPWRRFWNVTLPSIRPIIILLLILRLGDILTVGFEQMFLQRDAFGPEVAEVLDTFVYYTGIVNGDYGYATAAGLFKGVIGGLLIYAANRVAHQLGEQGVYR